MAIPQLYSQLSSHWPGLVRKLTKNTVHCDLLCIDLGSLLYSCLHRATDESRFLSLVVEFIQHLINLVDTKAQVFIAFDGVPPFAKFKEQASRRRRSYNTIISKINPHALSPGTEFMYNFETMLRQRMSKIASDMSLCIVLSGSAEIGEGEHKIISYIKRNPVLNTVVYGIDADLIVLSLISPCQQILIIREHVKTKTDVLSSKLFQFMNIKTLRGKFLENYPRRDDEYLFDIVLIIIMFGNDFTSRPQGSSMSDLYPLLRRLMHYHSENVGHYLVDSHTGDINLDKFLNFTKYFYDYDLTKYKLEYPNYKYDILQSSSLSLDLQNLSLGEKKSKIEINSTKVLKEQFDKWRFDNYYRWHHADKDQIKTIVSDYIESLQWVLKYYITGDSTAHCVYKHDFVPRISDLGWFSIDDIHQKNNDLPKSLTIKPIHHLALILPLKSKALLPLIYQKEEIPSVESLNYETLQDVINRFNVLDDQLTSLELLRNS